MRALFVVVLLGLVVAGCTSAPGIQVDQVVREAAPKPLPAEGPSAGQFERTWQSDVDTDMVEVLSTAGNLLVRTDNGVRAVDAATGKPSWRYVEPGHKLWDWTEVGNTVVLNLSAEDHADSHLVGLDTGTGKQLWERATDWQQYIGDGDAVVIETSDGEQIGVDARTGADRWRVDESRATGYCDDTKPGTQGGSLVLADVHCDFPDDTLAALDAATGELRWLRSRPNTVTMHGGYALLDGSEVVAPDGGTLYKEHTGCVGDLWVERDRIVLSCADYRLISIDPDTGAAVQLPDRPGVVSGTRRTFGGGRVYELRPGGISGSAPATAMMVVTDVASGKVAYAALPADLTRLDLGTGGWVGVVGDSFVVATSGATDRLTLTAYTLRATNEPTDLAGVSPQEWPDACALGAGATERSEPEPTAVTIGAVTLPNGACKIGPLRITVRWVAPTEADAVDLFGGGEPSTVGADEERGSDNYTVLLRVDRTILLVGYGGSDRDDVLSAVVANAR